MDDINNYKVVKLKSSYCNNKDYLPGHNSSISLKGKYITEYKAKGMPHGKAYGLAMAKINFPRQDEMAQRKIWALKNQTPAEKRIAELLTELNIYFRPQYNMKWQTKEGGKYYRVDFWLPDKLPIKGYKHFQGTKNKSGMVIECDGKSHENSQDYDQKRTDDLIKERGIKSVIRIKNEDCLTISSTDLLNLINDYKINI